MTDAVKKIWRDPVWSNVIASVFLLCVPYFWPAARRFLKSSTEVPNWLFIVILLVLILAYRIARTYKKAVDQSPSHASAAQENTAPQIEIHHKSASPYEVSEILHHHVLSTVRIGITNAGGRAISNCKVYIEKIVPEPPLPGGLPILLDGAGFTLRHDDPEKYIDVASHWDHMDKFKFSTPNVGGFAETQSYFESKQPLKITIKVVAVECQRCALFRIWTDDTKTMHLQFISYVS